MQPSHSISPLGGEFTIPRRGVASGRLEITRGASRLAISVDPSLADLLRAHFEGPLPEVHALDGVVTIHYRHLSPLDWARVALLPGQHAASIVLTGTVPWGLVVRGGLSAVEADLRGLRLEAFSVEGGGSKVTLALPAPTGTVPIRLAGGASGFTLHRPIGTAVRVQAGGGASGVRLDGQPIGAIASDTNLESPDYAQAVDRYDVAVSGGASGLTIDTW